MGHVYFFPSNTLVHNDKVLPIVLHLAAQGHRIETVFLTHEAIALCGESGPYAHWLRSLTRCRWCAFNVSGFWRRLLVRLRFAKLLCMMALRRGYVAFFDVRPTSRPLRILSVIARRNGTHVGYTPWYLDPFEAIDWRAVLADPERCRTLKGRVIEPATQVAAPTVACTVLLSYHPDAIQKYAGIPRERTLLISHPKLQTWWIAFLRQHPPTFDDAVVALERFVVVFLTHRGNYIFRRGSDLDVLLSEIIATVRRALPGIPIVLKPKQSLLAFPDQRRWLTEFVAGCGADVVLSEAPVALLALRAVAGITTGHTTAQFEFMVSEAPWIEYCRYSDFWASICAPLTYTPQYGGTWVETPEALDRVLQNLDRYRGDRKRYEKLLAFEEVPLTFEHFTQSARPAC